MYIDFILKHVNKVLLCLVLMPVLLISTFVGIYVYRFRNHDLSSHSSDWGQFGDYIGGLLNPTLALCALFALILAVIVQRKELTDAKNQFIKTTATLNRQTHDNTFFEMLSLHSQIVDSLRIDKKDLFMYNGKTLPANGRESFVEMHRCLSRYFSDPKNITEFKSKEELIRVVYNRFFENFQSSLAHYFRYLYNIVKFVDVLQIDEDQKIFYGKVIRAQLSNHELAILYFNCLSSLGKDNFKPLVEKYSLLKHLPPSLIEEGSQFFDSYSASAWGSNHDHYKNIHLQFVERAENSG